MVIRAQRGTIFDVRGRPLAKSIDAALGESDKGIGASHVRAAIIDTLPTGKRVYPFGEAAGAVIGYIGRDGDGLGGAEFAFDSELRGEDGWAIVQRDGRNKRYRKIGLPSKQPERGRDVYLTIDLDIQRIVEHVMAQTIARLGAKGGMCIVAEPASGKIRAMCNVPGFDPNFPARYPLEKRRNRCIGYNFEPGSTFKLITAATALEDGLINESSVLDGGNGIFKIYDQSIRDRKPFGKLTLFDAFSYSSNVCFARVATIVGNDRLHSYTKNFGFGARSGIHLPGEETGVVHPVREWSGRTCVTMAIGQEISATLLQIVLAFCAVANGGILLEPCICERTTSSGSGTAEAASCHPIRRIISEEVASRLRVMLKAVVDKGTGTRAAIQGVSIGGKTGTSQKLGLAEQIGSTVSTYWSSFIGMAPVNDPVLVIAVQVDDPAQGESGGEAAAPAFREILRQIISRPELDYAERILQSQAHFKPGSAVTALPRKTAPVAVGSAGASGSIGRNDSWARSGRKDAAHEVPNCIGKDTRDAVNVVSAGGLVPFVKGSGSVIRQSPAAGVRVEPAVICTLFCSFGG